MDELLTKSYFTAQEAIDLGVSRRMLSYYVQKGSFIKIGPGFYRSSEYDDSKDDQWTELAIASKRFKKSFICLISALVYYELTDELMDEYWIAVSHDRSKATFPNTRIVRMRNTELGIKKIKLSDIDVLISDKERTIIDTFRTLDSETGLKALKIYLSGKTGKANVKKLKSYSEKLNYDISKYITAIIT